MDPEEVLKSVIEESLEKGVSVVKINKHGSVAPGDNYGSQMNFYIITTKNLNGEQTELPVIAKSLPPNDYLRKKFNVGVTFYKETAFYQKLLPEYVKLVKESKLPGKDYDKLFPKFIGANVGPRGEVVDDTIIVMANIKAEGYCLGSRIDGLDLDHSRLFMKEIALFHALGIALKIKKTDLFYNVACDAGRPFREGQDIDDVKHHATIFANQPIDYLRNIQECAEFVPRLLSVIKKHFLYKDVLDSYQPREPFATFVHQDAWVKNIMFKYDQSGSLESLKLLDFQMTAIGSPLSDIFLFLYTSTTSEVFRNNFDELIKYYHDEYVQSLEALGVMSEIFSWDNFCEDMNKNATEEVPMLIAMLRVVRMINCVDLKEVSDSSFGEMGSGTAMKTRYIEMVQDLARRKWI